MKKLFTIICAIALGFSVSAQTWTERWTDESYMPEAGEWAIGIDATSTLNYFGNLFNASASAPTFDGVTGENSRFDQTIYGKLMTSDTEAWRVRFGIHMYKEVDNEDVDNNATSNNSDKVTDKATEGETDIKVWLGKEYRRGSTRLQGVYGAEFGFMMASGKETMDFGNSPEHGGVGVTEKKTGTQLGLGLRAFIGAEYFLLPKISIGGEYGWGFALISKGGGSETTVSWDAGDEKVETETQNFANDSESGFLFDNATGSLVLKMYF